MVESHCNIPTALTDTELLIKTIGLPQVALSTSLCYLLTNPFLKLWHQTQLP